VSPASSASGGSSSILHKSQASSRSGAGAAGGNGVSSSSKKSGGHHQASDSGRPNTTPITSIRVVSSRGAIGLSASGLGQLVPLGGATASHDNNSGDFLHEDLEDEDEVMLDDSVRSTSSSSVRLPASGGGGASSSTPPTGQHHPRQRQYSESYEHDQFDDDEATPRGGGGGGLLSARGGGHGSTAGGVTPRPKQSQPNKQNPVAPAANRKTSSTNSNNVASSAAAAAAASKPKQSSKGHQQRSGGGGAQQHPPQRTTSSNARRPVTAPDPGSPEPNEKKPPTIIQQHQQIQQELNAQKKKDTSVAIPPANGSATKAGGGGGSGAGGAAAAGASQVVVAKPTTTSTTTAATVATNKTTTNSSGAPAAAVVAGTVKRSNLPPTTTATTSSSANAAAAPQQGQQSSPLRVKVSHKAVIGKGSFGVVYQAMNLDTNHIIACKEICLVNKGSNAHSSADQVKQIKQELAMLKQLDHPNIVKCLGEDCDDKFLRIYMEYVTGGSISSIIKMFGSLQEKQASIFTHQMLEGLLYLHAKNICHRDLKGDNLLIDTRGVLKLADFGTAKELASQATSTVAGTAYFMAPEVIQGVGHGVEADVWSVGCCVIEMITGKPPFFHLKNQYAIMMHVAENSKSLDDVFPAGVSPECTAFLKRCLIRNPHDRATVKELLRHKWIVAPPDPILSGSLSHAGTSSTLSNTQTSGDGSATPVDDSGFGGGRGLLDTASIHLAGQQSMREAREMLQRERDELQQNNENGGAAVSSFNPMDLIEDDDDA
jgi:serine/threonine protein kinase